MRLAVSTTLCIALLATAASVLANTPDPAQSTFGNALGRSPKNIEVANPTFQYTFAGVLRNAAGTPLGGYPAQLDFQLIIKAPCQNPVTLLADGPSDPNGNILWGVAKLDQGGGACAGAAIVEVRSIQLGLFKTLNEVKSPDENGDTLVALQDLVTFQQAFVNQTPLYQGDLNLDGLIALQDLTFFQRHFVAP